jgi:protocatechuate 4,5-dioxygenase alpha chain
MAQKHPPIPGTTPFDGDQAMKGYALNKMCFLVQRCEANRQAFVADEEAYMRQYGLNEGSRPPRSAPAMCCS